MTTLTVSADALTRARQVVAPHVLRTATRRWPLLERLTGTETWLKHENHNPTAAFKVRGGLTYLSRLREEQPGRGVISASRGNHAQSLAYAGGVFGVPVTIVVPVGNSPDKDAATRAYGAEVVVHGSDFQESVEHARTLAEERGLHMVPAIHPWLVEGVATYPAEMHEDAPGLDRVYVPVGMGSGISAHLAVRDLLGLSTEVVGVVAEGAPAYALSVAAGRPVATERADTFVDGVACRVPDPSAVATMVAGGVRVVVVSDQQAKQAMVELYRATHNLVEPAGALGLAAATAEREANAGRRIGLVLTGGNADHDVLEAAFAASAG
ncbi:threonine dehydratase [Auraticoccus sp. F435]|uniref:threonine ammonia-lyase n=1 Tax=Auraticoccus cholistanensis TaxID=2656650 RepID=A0A6A9V1X6_9ACTN|nr:threonine dehydratase [Auraticoccus cholistanensis]MVA77595.1 threonine dehydratase [Auraticoccus cholistanensis]